MGIYSEVKVYPRRKINQFSSKGFYHVSYRYFGILYKLYFSEQKCNLAKLKNDLKIVL